MKYPIFVDDWSNIFFIMKEEGVKRVLEIGAEIIGKKGFNAVGINEILEAADIPKGSFYYYFKNKEDFGLQLISHTSQQSIAVIGKYLEDGTMKPKERILKLFNEVRKEYVIKQFAEGCLLGNCSIELSDVKPTYAQAINKEFENWDELFRRCIEEGQQDSSIKAERTAEDLASFILNSWEGSLLRMKSSKSIVPFDIFVSFVDQLL